MEPEDKLPSLAKLGDDIRKFQDKSAPKAPSGRPDAGLGMRLGIELVAGVLVGVGAGVMLDRWLGTQPLFLLVCFFLGTGGGAMNMVRTVQAMSKDNEATGDEGEKK